MNWPALLVLIAAVAVCVAAPQDHKPSNVKGAGDPFLNGAPFTLEQVLRLLGQDAIPVRRRKEAIQNRGLAFSLSPAEIDKLKGAGASDDMLKLIVSKAKPSSASIPAKPLPTGTIAVACAPAECEISVNGTSVGPTKDGILELTTLNPGKWAVDLKKDGYITAQNLVTVEADRAVSVSAVLEPSRATQEALGAELFRKVVQAIGGMDAVKELDSVQAAGSATIKSVRWTLLMRNKPDRALFQAQAGGVLHEVAYTGSQIKTSKSLKGQDALELPTSLGFIRDNQLSALIGKLSEPQFKMLASHPYPLAGEEFTFTADAGTGKISIGLDSELRPQRIRTGSALITYSDYLKVGNAAYPRTIQIKPDGWQQGIDVHFDTVQSSPKLSDADYKLKGKPLIN